MKINKNIFLALGFMALFHPVQASDQEVSPLLHLPDAAFVVQADNMSMKDLHALARSSKAGLAKVKKYFAIKKNTFMNTKCPVLTREWVVNFSKTEPKTGLKAFFTQAQSLPEEFGPIVEIGGVKWGINVHKLNKSKLSDLPDHLEPRSDFFLENHTGSMPNLGVFHVQNCYYSNNMLNFTLTTEFETLFDEAAPAAPAH